MKEYGIYILVCHMRTIGVSSCLIRTKVAPVNDHSYVSIGFRLHPSVSCCRHGIVSFPSGLADKDNPVKFFPCCLFVSLRRAAIYVMDKRWQV